MSDENELSEAQLHVNGNGVYMTRDEGETLIAMVQTIADEQLQQKERIAGLHGLAQEMRDMLAAMRLEVQRIARSVGA